MLSTVFLLNKDATILIEKQYREVINRSDIDAACLAIRERTRQPPTSILNGDKTILLHQQGEIWIVGVCEQDEFAFTAVSILEYIGRCLQDSLRDGATEFSIKAEYPAVYQILDYAVDYGFVYLNEQNTIQTMLTRPPVDLAKGIRLNLDLARPWRSCNVKHSTNEIFLDVIETVDVAVSQHGKTEFCHIRGAVEVRSSLSELPFCKLILMPSTHYEDATFHRCVDIDISDTNTKVIPFVPPDGHFTLMKYRITATQSTIPLWIVPKFNWVRGCVTFEICLKQEASLTKPMEGIEVRFELPEGVFAPSLAAQIGRATYDNTLREVTWIIGTWPNKDLLVLSGSASLDPAFDLCGRFPIVSAKFVSVGKTTSGFKVDRLEVEGIPYKCYKGVKYISTSGNYEFRTGLC